MPKRITTRLPFITRLVLLYVLSITLPARGIAMEKPYPGSFFENDQLLMVVVPRTPDQMAAFYEARGFPEQAIDRVTDTCFVTIHIDNKSRRITWLETANWRLVSKGREVHILGGEYWDATWKAINLPQAYRSTFFWTQLPPVVDLHPDEPVGGNIVLPGHIKRFDLEANFNTGADRLGDPLQVQFNNIECGEVPDTP